MLLIFLRYKIIISDIIGSYYYLCDIILCVSRFYGIILLDLFLVIIVIESLFLWIINLGESIMFVMSKKMIAVVLVIILVMFLSVCFNWFKWDCNIVIGVGVGVLGGVVLIDGSMLGILGGVVVGGVIGY